MPAGRPRKPIELRKATDRKPGVSANGTVYADTSEVAVIEPDSVQVSPYSVRPIPVPPDTLKDRGLSEWEKVWTAGYWLHPEEDYAWVIILSKAYDDMVEFRERVEEDGLIVKGYAGQVVAHPLIAEIRKCELQIMKCLSILGFSPSDRARLGIQEMKLKTGLSKLQEKTQRNRTPKAAG